MYFGKLLASAPARLWEPVQGGEHWPCPGWAPEGEWGFLCCGVYLQRFGNRWKQKLLHCQNTIWHGGTSCLNIDARSSIHIRNYSLLPKWGLPIDVALLLVANGNASQRPVATAIDGFLIKWQLVHIWQSPLHTKRATQTFPNYDCIGEADLQYGK